MTNKEAIVIISELIEFYESENLKEAFRLAVKALEDRPQGSWIKTIGENGVTSAARCSECGFGDNRYMLFNFCPNCSADMRVKDNDIQSN